LLWDEVRFVERNHQVLRRHLSDHQALGRLRLEAWGNQGSGP
jgi:hypothetical protein